MPKRSSTPDETDVAADGSEPTDESTETPADTRDPLAVELGRRGGLKGGKARAAKLTAEQRSEIARKAATTRWRKRDS